jgi:O-antigen ligase
MAAKFDKKVYEKFSLSIVLMNFINTIVLIISPASRIRYKTIGGISIQINYFENVRFSAAALTALLAIILVYKFKSKGFRSNLLIVSTVISGLYNIITLGKLSVLLGLSVAVLATTFLFHKNRNQIITKIAVNIILIFTFLSGWILRIVIELTSSLDINYALLTGRRNMIWSAYIDYFSDVPTLNKFFGSFFIRTYNDIVQPGLPHPHNQWITILISMGLFGLILYFLLLRKAYYCTIESRDKVGFAYMVAINIFATTDDYILLTAGCLNAFLIFYFAIHPPKIEKNLTKLEVK